MSVRKRTWQHKGVTKTAWVVDYKDQQGKRRLKTFKTKKAAERWAPKVIVEVQQGTHSPDSTSITVKQAAENWIARVKVEGRERSTIAQYRQHIDYHIDPLLGQLKLSQLTRPRMERARDELLETRSRAMAKKVLSSVKSLLSDAQRRGDVAQNVALGVSIRIQGRHKRKLAVGMDIPSVEEIQLLLRALEGTLEVPQDQQKEILSVLNQSKEGERTWKDVERDLKASTKFRPILLTAVFTGLRASELRGLTWDDVDQEAKLIFVRRRADRYNQIGSPKSQAGSREVPISPMVVNTLNDWEKACPEGELGLVFPNGAGNVESLANIYNRGLAPIQVAAGMISEEGKPKYGLHALRHFYASWLINRKQDGGLELPPKKVQERLGHSSIQMTLDVYGHLFPTGGDEHDELVAAERALVG